jgi:ssDNA-binding Zn-finger/Zn-ribbon topoisomerase 1
MDKTCLKCRHVNHDYTPSEFAKCPECDAIYSKAEAAAAKQKQLDHKNHNKIVAEGIKIEEQKQKTITNKKKQLQWQYVCTECLTLSKPAQKTPGSILIEIVLWLCFLIPGLIYSIWRLNSRHKMCPSCHQKTVIPATSPRGKKLLENT